MKFLWNAISLWQRKSPRFLMMILTCVAEPKRFIRIRIQLFVWWKMRSWEVAQFDLTLFYWVVEREDVPDHLPWELPGGQEAEGGEAGGRQEEEGGGPCRRRECRSKGTRGRCFFFKGVLQNRVQVQFCWKIMVNISVQSISFPWKFSDGSGFKIETCFAYSYTYIVYSMVLLPAISSVIFI